MTAYARHVIVADDEVGVYHCIARCVRRAFLCGTDPVTGHNYEHRKDWIRERLEQLASIFAIDICGYVVMSNHLHLILRIRPDLVRDCLRIGLDTYLSLVDWTGREIRGASRGTIPAHFAPILERLHLKDDRWIETVRQFGRWFKRAVGRRASLKILAEQTGRRWFHGQRAAGVAFL
jgi:REP element-mobilizing transposase RayT